MISAMKLNEGFEKKIADKGTIKFSETKISDPHIQKILDHVSKVTGVLKSKIEDEILDEEKKFRDIEAKAPILYGTIAKNIIEDEVFKLVQDLIKNGSDRLQGAPTFNPAVFLKLVKRIKAEHDQFFPLRNFIDHKYLKNERIVITPSDKPENKHLNSVPTACATAKGEFAFNRNFMQSLIDFAYVKDLKGQGKKWKSNGGDIPDDYVYIEFLIIHEFMHFTYADFHYHKIYKVSNKIINWVGDFRTNYLLVKSGYHQLPMGLFNDDINYDRQKSYKEMIDIVKSEFDKLNEDQQDKVSKRLSDSGDDHSNPGDMPDDDDVQPTEDDVENKNKDVERKMGDKGDKSADDIKPEEKKGKPNPNAQEGGPGRGKNGSEKFDYSNVKPTYTWQQLLKKLISDVDYSVEETYQKPSRSSIRNMHLARQSGAGAVKPGEVITENPNRIKLCFVVDSSGSMTSAIAKIYANIENLFKTNKKMLHNDFFLIKFSDTHALYRCNLKSMTYAEIKNVDDKADMKKGTMKVLFTEHFGSSTNFDGPLISDLEKLNAKGFNILLVTDTDILHGSNLENFFKLYAKSKKNLYVIADSKQTYGAMLTAMKQIAKNITYID